MSDSKVVVIANFIAPHIPQLVAAAQIGMAELMDAQVKPQVLDTIVSARLLTMILPPGWWADPHMREFDPDQKAMIAEHMTSFMGQLVLTTREVVTNVMGFGGVSQDAVNGILATHVWDVLLKAFQGVPVAA